MISFKTYYLQRPGTVTALVFMLWMIITVWIYHDGLHGPLLLDDEVHIVPLLDADLSQGKWTEYIFSNSGPLKRPVAMASFLLDAKIHGNATVWWKFTNLLIHLVTALAVYIFTFYLLQVPGVAVAREQAWSLALVPAVIWLLHPLHVSTVLYLVQRMSALAALFVFAALAAYTCGRHRQLSGKKGNLLILLAFLVLMPLGALSKENALLFPLFALLLELFFFRFRIVKHGMAQDYTFLRYVLIVPVGLALILIVFSLQGFVFQLYSNREFTVDQRLLTQFRILFRYIYQLLVPVNSNMGFIYDDIRISDGWFSPLTTLVSFLGVITLLSLAWWRRNVMPLAGFGISFFFAAHLMESSILPLEMMYEHRNYIPSYGIILALTAVLFRVVTHKPVRNLLLVMAAVTLSFQTINRVEIWSSAENLYGHLFTIHPGSPRLAAVQANILAYNSLYNEARELLSRFDTEGTTLQQMNIECLETGQLADARLVAAAQAFAGALDMYAIREMQLLADSGLNGQCRFNHHLMIELLDRVLQLSFSSRFDRHKLYVYKGRYLWKAGLTADALEALQASMTIVQDDPVPMLLAAEWLAGTGDIEQAKKYYNAAVVISGESDKRYDQVFAAVKRLIDRIEARDEQSEY